MPRFNYLLPQYNNLRSHYNIMTPQFIRSFPKYYLFSSRDIILWPKDKKELQISHEVVSPKGIDTKRQSVRHPTLPTDNRFI